MAHSKVQELYADLRDAERRAERLYNAGPLHSNAYFQAVRDIETAWIKASGLGLKDELNALCRDDSRSA